MKKSKKQAGNIEDAKNDTNKEVENSLLEKVISLGIESYLEIIEDEITNICDERYKHISGREFVRWSTTDTPAILGGRKISVRHTRVCIDLLQNLIDRGLNESEIKLAVIDG